MDAQTALDLQPRRPWMQQLGNDVLGPPRARNSDPVTSHEAAASVVDVAETQRALILGFVKGCRHAGANHSEIDVGLGWPQHTANRRLHELRAAGLLIRTATKRPTISGRPAFVHVAPEYASQEGRAA